MQRGPNLTPQIVFAFLIYVFYTEAYKNQYFPCAVQLFMLKNVITIIALLHFSLFLRGSAVTFVFLIQQDTNIDVYAKVKCSYGFFFFFVTRLRPCGLQSLH